MGGLFQATAQLLVMGPLRDAYSGMLQQQMAVEGARLFQALVLLEGGMSCVIGGRGSHACGIQGGDMSTVGPSCGGRDSSDDGDSRKTTRRARKTCTICHIESCN